MYKWLKKLYCIGVIVLLASNCYAQRTVMDQPQDVEQEGGEYFLRLDTANDPITGALETSNGSILSSASGVLTLGGTGNTNNENLTLDFETTSNRIIINSGTSAFPRFDSHVMVADLQALYIGTDTNSAFSWTTAGSNENLKLGLNVGNAAYSGYFSLVEKTDLNHANRSPAATSANPVLRVYSSDATQANDYIEMYHNQTDAHIATGSGDLYITPAGGDMFVLGAGFSSGGVLVLDGGNEALGLGDRADSDIMYLYNNANEVRFYFDADKATIDDSGNFTALNGGAFIANSTGDDKNVYMLHDDTDAYIVGSSGVIHLDSADWIELDSHGVNKGTVFSESSTDSFGIVLNNSTDQVNFITYDNTGNQVNLTNVANYNVDHDHATTTNPTLYVHSDTSPDTANDEWISLTHDVTDAVIGVGSGGLKILPLAGTYGSGSAYVCVYDSGVIYASDSACP